MLPASTKRSHECWASSGGGIVAEQNHRQPSSSPVRATAAPPSPSSSNASFRKKIVSFVGVIGVTSLLVFSLMSYSNSG